MRSVLWLSLAFALVLGSYVISELARPVPFISTHPLPHQLWCQGMSRTELNDAELLCSGHFAPIAAGWFNGPGSVDLTIDDFTYRGVQRDIVPFLVDHYWKGTGPGRVDVALFSDPPLIGNVFTRYGSMTQGRLLLALKKDTTGSRAYQLTGIVDSWLLIPERALENVSGAAPEKVVETAAVEALGSYATYTPPPESSGHYEIETGQLDMLDQALSTLKASGTSDPATLQALEAIYTDPQLGSSHYWAFDALKTIDLAEACHFGLGLYEAGKLDGLGVDQGNDRMQLIDTISQVDPVQACKLGEKAYASGTLTVQDRQSFRVALARAIKPETFAQLDPSYIDKVITGDHEAEIMACESFSLMAQRNDPRCIPWLGRLLSSSFPPDQYRAMGALRYLNWKREGRWYLQTPLNPHNSIPGPKEPYPEEIVAPYQDWVKRWLEQHPEDAIPSLPATD